ncbi:hypothetical protein PYCCODRAFT_340565 [Trametes coccinea BRFM310]|uniref:Ubiquitin-like domain-containing protein n=1 Tax=Trametes coccinea (strain BRFM310) TaxID=1353009 RepID=A0A1Y2J2Q7_TRAC3|nr:hypothetical protein PYCCODRAFT_340565 [Trametes coccinea BRFM310]
MSMHKRFRPARLSRNYIAVKQRGLLRARYRHARARWRTRYQLLEHKLLSVLLLSVVFSCLSKATEVLVNSIASEYLSLQVGRALQCGLYLAYSAAFVYALGLSAPVTAFARPRTGGNASSVLDAGAPYEYPSYRGKEKPASRSAQQRTLWSEAADYQTPSKSKRPEFTIFVQGISTRSVALHVHSTDTVDDILSTLRRNRLISSGKRINYSVYYTPYTFAPLARTTRLDQIGVGALSSLQVRARVLGGSRRVEESQHDGMAALQNATKFTKAHGKATLKHPDVWEPLTGEHRGAPFVPARGESQPQAYGGHTIWTYSSSKSPSN